MLIQFRVPCGRPASPGAGQAGEDRLPRADDDGGGTDAGVVPPQGDGVTGHGAAVDRNKIPA